MSPSSTPLVSVGVPVYNGAQFLPRALDALLAQDWPSLEILVSDNGSTDASAGIAESYAARDPRVRLMRSPVNAGMEANFARVLQSARGRYFMWAACDDWWGPQFVRRLVAALEQTPAAVVAMSAVERVDESGALVDVVRHGGAADPSRMSAWRLTMQLAGGRPYHLFVYGLYRRDFLERAFTGFARVVAADRLFICRVAMAGRFAYVDEVLHRRLVRKAPIAERYGDEAIGGLWRASFPRWRLALRAGPYLWSSPVLPPSRALWVPAVVARFLKAGMGHTLVRARRLRGRRGGSSPTW
ncbi:MAG: glycosyltransferase family 2 protein [Acidobacteria bacterium]|nr:glycosyltransferase family 2 protein [Acidobacteriota bacterium]